MAERVIGIPFLFFYNIPTVSLHLNLLYTYTLWITTTLKEILTTADPLNKHVAITAFTTVGPSCIHTDGFYQVIAGVLQTFIDI